MTTSTNTAPQQRDFRALIEHVAPKRGGRDLFGFLAGYRAYLLYTELAAKSDKQLAGLGLSRKDLPRVAMDAAFDARGPSSRTSLSK